MPKRELYLDVAAEEFNIITPENSHKMGWIQPQPGEFRFDDAARLADYAEANNMILHGHPLVWYTQLPGWVIQLDPADAEQVMLDHIAAVAGRYAGRIGIWDAVNEALEDDGTLRNSIWHQGMGADYIRKAFVAAKLADPDAAMIYNDYDVAWENAKSDGMYNLLKKELAAGTPIDGVGFQMHLRSGFTDFDSMERNFQRFADTDDYQAKPSYEAWQDTLKNFICATPLHYSNPFLFPQQNQTLIVCVRNTNQG